MKKKDKISTDEKIKTLNKINRLVILGKTNKLACKEIGISVSVYNKWQKECTNIWLETLESLKQENSKLKKQIDEVSVENLKYQEIIKKKDISLRHKKELAISIMEKFKLSEIKACKFVDLSRSTFKYKPKKRSDEEALRNDINSLAIKHEGYGYKRITDLLRSKGWIVNKKRVLRIWREEGLIRKQVK